MKNYSKEELRLLTEVLPNIAAGLRGDLANIYMAVNRLAPVEARERDEKTAQNAAVFSQSFFRMIRTLGNLSDAAMLADDAPLRLFNDDVVGLCRDVCEKAAPLFAMNGVTLDFEGDRSTVIALNAAMLRRLLFNLLSNALKATPAGGRVGVRVKCGARSVQIIVSDTGSGIRPERLETIFDSFLPADPADLSLHGVGLGLALCRRIAQGHGGRIVAESKEGEGTTFTVSLPNVKSPNDRLREPGFDYTGGFNPTLVELADALPARAFSHQYLD